MAKKKTEAIIGIGRSEDKLLVEKSLPLFSLWQSDLTLAEFKILDTYLSRIDSHHPERKAVMFEKGELEKLLGVKKINNADLKQRLKHLMGNVVEIADPEDVADKKGFRMVTLFEEAEAKQDEFGMWQVKLEATQKAMKYFFNIENLGYLRYKLRCITAINSRYAYILFIYLEHNRFRKKWTVRLDDLKKMLACENEPSYAQFKVFNDRVLKRTQAEIIEKTECKFGYQPIKKGRTVVEIEFEVETLPKIIDEIEGQYQIAGWDEIQPGEDTHEQDLWAAPILDAGLKFTKEDYDAIFSLLTCVPENKLPHIDGAIDRYSIDNARFHYINIRVREMLRYDAKKPIKHKSDYLLKMIRHDIEEE